MSKRKRAKSRAEPEAVMYRKPKKNDHKHEAREATESNTTRQPFIMAPQTGTHIFFLFIGSPCEALTLHSGLLTPATNTYLLTRFGAQQLCYMPEEDHSIANLWRLYLYTDKIYSDNEAADQDADDSGAESHADGEWTKLAHAYFFGQKICDERFANACVTALIEKVKATERFPTGIASEVYWYTQPRDGLRKLIVDLHVWMGEGTCMAEPHEDAVESPEEFVEDFRREMAWAEAVEWQAEGTWETNPCAYHSHVLTRRC